jgi:uncharacterized repeat protein (TIGR01451 family)
VNALPDLSLDKRHTSPFTVGLPGSYTLVVTNQGLAPTSAQTTVTDTLPAGLVYTGGAGAGWTIAQSGAVITATHAAAIAGGDSSGFTLTVDVTASAFPAVTNAATVRTAGDVNGANDRDVDPTAITGSPDLALDKRHSATFIAGQSGVYTLVTTNLGTAATSGMVTVRDTLPAGLTFVSGTGAGWSVGASGQVVTADHAAPIAPNDSATFTLIVAVGAAALPAVTNSASVSVAADPFPANDRDVDPTAVLGLPDLALDKRHTANFVDRQNGAYTLVVTNVGFAPSVGAVTVTDTLPAGLTYVAGAGAGWSVAASGSIVTATHAGTIAMGDSASFALTVAVGAAAVPAVTNTAVVAGGGDTSPANDRDVDPTTVLGVTDLALDKRHTGPFVVGQNGVYRLVVTNVGSAATAGTATVVDTLPTGLGNPGRRRRGLELRRERLGGHCDATQAPIAAGDSAAFTLTVDVGPPAVPAVTNQAQVSVAGDVARATTATAIRRPSAVHRISRSPSAASAHSWSAAPASTRSR